MAKPTADTKWSSIGTKVEPSSGQKDAGWAVGQKPPAQWLNWWMDAVDQWKVWLAAFESTVHTWTALQTLQAGITVTQSVANTRAINATGNGTASALRGTGGATGPGVEGFGGASGGTGVEGTGTVSGDGVIGTGGPTDGRGVVGVGGGSSPGVLGTGGAGASGIVGVSGAGGGLNRAGLEGDGSTNANGVLGTTNATARAAVKGLNAGAGPGVHGAASTTANAEGVRASMESGSPATAFALKVFKETGGAPDLPDSTFLGVVAAIFGALKFPGNNPLKTAGFTNSLTNLHGLKAMISWTPDTTVTPDHNEGVNFAAPSESDVGGVCETVMTFATPMADASYIVDLNCEDVVSLAQLATAGTIAPPKPVVKNGSKTTTGFIVKYVLTSPTGPVAFFGNQANVAFMTYNIRVFGRQ